MAIGEAQVDRDVKALLIALVGLVDARTLIGSPSLSTIAARLGACENHARKVMRCAEALGLLRYELPAAERVGRPGQPRRTNRIALTELTPAVLEQLDALARARRSGDADAERDALARLTDTRTLCGGVDGEEPPHAVPPSVSDTRTLCGDLGGAPPHGVIPPQCDTSTASARPPHGVRATLFRRSKHSLSAPAAGSPVGDAAQGEPRRDDDGPPLPDPVARKWADYLAVRSERGLDALTPTQLRHHREELAAMPDAAALEIIAANIASPGQRFRSAPDRTAARQAGRHTVPTTGGASRAPNVDPINGQPLGSIPERRSRKPRSSTAAAGGSS